MIPPAVAEALATIFPGPAAYATVEAMDTARTLTTIAQKAAAGELTERQAAVLVEMERQETLIVAMAARGAKTIDQQNAINGAIDILKAVIVKAAGAVV